MVFISFMLVGIRWIEVIVIIQELQYGEEPTWKNLIFVCNRQFLVQPYGCRINGNKNDFNENIKKATEEYDKALEIHDIWETFYISNMNFEKADNFTEEIIEKIVPKNIKSTTKGLCYDRYLGAATPVGSKDYVLNLTEGLKKYFINLIVG